MRMVKSYGFDVMPLIGRSPLHTQSHEHDLGNYLRLRALAAGTRTLVFDGGYVFDSVYRTILEGGVSGVWIRRGLWQDGQDNSVALDREKVFDRVIVPSEAFEELNAALFARRASAHGRARSFSEVRLSAERARPAARPSRRHATSCPSSASWSRCSAPASRPTGACRSRRSAGIFERRSDTLHLVLVWPSGRARARLVRLAQLPGGAHAARGGR